MIIGSRIFLEGTMLSVSLILPLRAIDTALPSTVSGGQVVASSDSSGLSQKELFALYMEEWKTVIQTQMHFNDLILRFRSFVLAAIGALFGALVAWNAARDTSQNKKWVWILGTLLFAMWTSAFIMDYCYYFKLLLGAVESAEKYDVFGRTIKPQLFGLTDVINHKVSVAGSIRAIIAYYALPPLFTILAVSLRPWKWFKTK